MEQDISLEVISVDEKVCRICLENDGQQQQLCNCLPVHVKCLAKQQSYKAQNHCEICLTPYRNNYRMKCSYIGCCTAQYKSKCYNCILPCYHFIILIARCILILGISLFSIYMFLALLSLLLMTPLYILQVDNTVPFIMFIVFVTPAVLILALFLLYKGVHNWDDILYNLTELYICCCGCLPCTFEQQVDYETV